MDYTRIPEIAEISLEDGGVMVTFADGLCAIYSPAVLHACLSLAEIVSERTCEDVKADNSSDKEP
jgi:hypothetical protein